MVWSYFFATLLAFLVGVYGTPIARAAAQTASASIGAIQQNQAKITHIFDAAKHGFIARGIGYEAGIRLIGQTIAAEVARAGGPGNLVVGQVYRWTRTLDATTRLFMIGTWNGTVFQVGTAYLQVLVNGQWVPYWMAP